MILVGSDPEIMLEDANGKLVNALNVISGRKYMPTQLSSGQVIADNVNVEINPPPSHTSSGFVDGIRHVLSEVKQVVGDLNLVAQTSAVFPEDEMTHPESYLFGCEPEFDGWTGAVVSPPSSDDLFRSCGGHIHVGADQARKHALHMIRSMDFYLGIPSVLLDNDPSSLARQRLYGGSGKFRSTSYGVEYRTLGSFWLSRPELADVMFHLAQYAVQDVMNPVDSSIRAVINSANRGAARRIVDTQLQERIPRYLFSEINELSQAPHNRNLATAWSL